MIAVADAGFRAIAPDFRGYGLSQQPPEPENASWSDLIADLLSILDHFSASKVFVVARDFGAMVAYQFALLFPDRVSGVVTLSVPFVTEAISINTLPEGFYMLRWLVPGRAEADFGRFDVRTVVRNIYILFSGSELPVAAEDQEIMDLVDASSPLPTWFSEEDLTAYAALYENSGFCFPLQIPYRKLDDVEGVENPKVQVPALFVVGEKDYILKFPGMDDYVRSGTVKNYVPDLDIKFIPEGSHFVQEQFPEEVNRFLLSFLKKHSP
ncbi:unnamed protein product [Spirodela intermedia]|uniref:AB hydrolase-1 domain-containing protein n=1 Tax=Spirodela intermedia TaxID=51605 RepID=A0A7I8IFM3_SPIIN|nr:unnamed protein product [Spirodela intermedia]CAA6655682.1 unnamed protein product [Spirodela intermedia]